MSDIQLSIVVPVYNGELFIKQSLQVILEQATEKIEVIIVDDGSIDETIKIIQESFTSELAENLLVLIKQNNQGVSAARNQGIAIARGQYIGFMDADDIVLPNYIQTLLIAIASGADIIEFGFKTFSTNAAELDDSQAMYSNDQFGMVGTTVIINKLSAIARWYPWTRVFKATLFETLRFPAGIRFCEDLMTIPFLYEKATTVFSLREVLYGYRVNAGSATFNVRPDYVKKLQDFYQVIPRTGLRWHDYLRMSVAFAIYSCQIKSDTKIEMPALIQSDMRRLRYTLSVYQDIEPRRILLLLYPRLFEAIKAIKTIMRRR